MISAVKASSALRCEPRPKYSPCTSILFLNLIEIKPFFPCQIFDDFCLVIHGKSSLLVVNEGMVPLRRRLSTNWLMHLDIAYQLLLLVIGDLGDPARGLQRVSSSCWLLIHSHILGGCSCAGQASEVIHSSSRRTRLRSSLQSQRYDDNLRHRLLIVSITFVQAQNRQWNKICNPSPKMEGVCLPVCRIAVAIALNGNQLIPIVRTVD